MKELTDWDSAGTCLSSITSEHINDLDDGIACVVIRFEAGMDCENVRRQG